MMALWMFCAAMVAFIIIVPVVVNLQQVLPAFLPACDQLILQIVIMWAALS